jgi:hypothetical protein
VPWAMDLRQPRRSLSSPGPRCCLLSSTNTHEAKCDMRAARPRMAKIWSIDMFNSLPTFIPHLGHHRILINSRQIWPRVDRHCRSFSDARPSVAQPSSCKASTLQAARRGTCCTSWTSTSHTACSGRHYCWTSQSARSCLKFGSPAWEPTVTSSADQGQPSRRAW